MLAKPLGITGLLLLGALLAGCGGGGAKVTSTATTTTMGQELQDLDAAYQKGLITEKEYDKAKSDILKRYK